MEPKSYTLKKYLGKQEYGVFEEELIEKSVSGRKSNLLLHFDDTLFEDYSLLFLPQKSLNNLDQLLGYFSLDKFEEDFLYLIAITQSAFILYNEEFEGDLSEDFLKEKKDLEKLIIVLEEYLFNDPIKSKPSSIKFFTKEPQTISNFFVTNYIYKTILEYYGLNKDNFKSKKQELLKGGANNFNFHKGGEYIKSIAVKSLFDFLKENAVDISDKQALECCGVFLHICQIPYKKTNDDIDIEEIENALYIIDYQNLRHYITNRPNFYI